MATQAISITVEGAEETSPADENTNNTTGSVENSVANTDTGKSLPLLRVEELKDETTAYTSGEEDQIVHDVSDDPDKNLPEVVPPTDELKDKIIKQVEFYFSDASILKDAFLLKHVRRNKQGYVSIKLITSFKKMKSLTKDYRVVAFSLRHSDQLEVNEEGKKVRRKNPLPEYDETTPSRSVLVVNLPMENPSIENVAEMFSKSGDVVLIRILRPNKPVPQDIKKYSNKHPEIGHSVCAVVEFEKHEHAKHAVDTMNNAEDWRNGLRVVLVAEPKKKPEKNAEHKNGEKKEKKDVKNNVENDEKKKKRRAGKRQGNKYLENAHNDDSSCYSSGSEYDPPVWRQPHGTSLSPSNVDNSKLSPGNSPRTSPMTSPRSQRRRLGPHGKSPLADHSPTGSPKPSPRSSPESGRKKYDCSSGGDSTPSSPWVQRRLRAAQELSISPLAGSPAGSPMLARKDGAGKLADMSGVTRQPKGPDGTNGFHLGRGKPRASTIC